MEVIISPIFYMGNKKRLIKKGLIDLFLKNIDVFVDLFSGSGIVSMNTKANQYILNDIDVNLNLLYKVFQIHSEDEIIAHIENRIEEFNLPKERTPRYSFKDKEKLEQYKNSYTKFRAFYNETKNPLDLYTLMFFAFSQQFRFNNKDEFNIPYGNGYFTETNKEYIKNGVDFFQNKEVKIVNTDFKEIIFDYYYNDFFVYLDPPYLNTTAIYTENNGWDMSDEISLYNLCEEYNRNGIKFGMSNVFHNKGKEHTSLIDWCNRKDWNVYTFDSHTYSACGKGNSNAKEVFITNY